MDQRNSPNNSQPEPTVEAARTDVMPAENGTVAVAPAPAQTAEEVAESTPAPADQQIPQVVAPSKPKSSVDTATKLAIAAAIIVVVMLGIMATIIYLKQK